RKTDRAERSFQRRTDHVKRQQVEGEMEIIEVQKQRSKQMPILVSVDNGRGFEGAESMKSERLLPILVRNLEKKHRDLEQRDHAHGRRVEKTTMSILRGFVRRNRRKIGARFVETEQFDFVTQLRARMH